MTRTPVEPASELDFDSLCALLRAAHLPTDALADHLRTALVARDAGGIIGCVALELYGSLALLRSLAVSPSRRGQGLGLQPVHAALDLARHHRVTTVYLLTTTASDFFARHFGFRPIVRTEVPEALLQSVEFVSACPQTAQTMLREIQA